jgi:hypothetical protein
MSANVVFINIDGKASRHNRTLKANMNLLGKTITQVVHNMNPTMICMCEVGEATKPLTKEQMQEVATLSMHAWKEAATEHFELRSMFEVGAPYMTIYIDGPIQCSRHRILKDLYNVEGQPRTAQTFLCCGPGGMTVDVINVHAPSGKKKLTVQQRKKLLTSLLQSNSQSIPGEPIGSARFLIGGDMNAAPFMLSQLLLDCRSNGSLRTRAQIHDSVFAKHGDVCFLGGFKGDVLTTTAESHDPQHKPYGICWSMEQESATEQSLSLGSSQTKDESTPQQHAASSSGYATEQPLQASPTPAPTPETPMPAQLELESNKLDMTVEQSACWQLPTVPGSVSHEWNKHRAASSGGYATEQTSQARPTPAPTSKPAMQAQLELENQESRAEQTVLTGKDIMQELESMHAKYGTILKPEDFHRQSDEEAAASAAAAATEQSQDASTTDLAYQDLPADKKMIYSIVDEFLGKITFNNPEAEALLVAALTDESCLAPSMHLRVKEVFEPIFFHFPHGLKDRSVWEPRDANQYIRQWYKLASMRTWVTNAAAATEHSEEFSKAQVTQIFKWYMEDMKKTLRPDQLNKSWSYYKSCAEANMKREAGHTYVANVIWAIGLPQLQSFATEQRDEQQTVQDLESIPAAIHSVLNWLDRLANALTTHKTTKEYQEAVRKSGVAHGESGLTATEQEIRTATRKAKLDIRTATSLARQWDDRTLTFNNWHRWQKNLLHAYWNGSLHRRLEEI